MLKHRLGRLILLCLLILPFIWGCEEMDQATLDYADGSGNHYRVTKVPQPRLVYTPVKPATSSSGSYDGGEPVDRAISEAAYFEILKAVTAGYENKNVQIADRVMMSGAVSITSENKQIDFILRPGCAEQLAIEKALKAALKP